MIIGGVLSVCLLSGCGLLTPPPEGTGAYPSAGPLPPVGTVWETDDGSAGLRLTSADTADVWGIPWYTGVADCSAEHLEYVSGSFEFRVFLNESGARLTVNRELRDPETGVLRVEGRTFYRSTRFEGWQTLRTSACEQFNDGHDLELHMVGEADQS